MGHRSKRSRSNRQQQPQVMYVTSAGSRGTPSVAYRSLAAPSVTYRCLDAPSVALAPSAGYRCICPQPVIPLRGAAGVNLADYPGTLRNMMFNYSLAADSSDSSDSSDSDSDSEDEKKRRKKDKKGKKEESSSKSIRRENKEHDALYKNFRKSLPKEQVVPIQVDYSYAYDP